MWGHEVALAGVNSTTNEVLISDPDKDAFEKGNALGQTSVSHNHPSDEEAYTMHNDAKYTSYDAYVVENDSVSSYILGYGGGFIDDLTKQIVLSPPAKWRIEVLALISCLAPTHDIAVTNIVLSKTIVGEEYTMQINVTIENQGNYTESFLVTLYADTSIIGTKGVNLESNSFTTITFTWDTTGFAKGNYTISAYAWPVPGETDTSDNTCIGDIVTVVIPGDVNADGIVEMMDFYVLAQHYMHSPPDGHAIGTLLYHECFNADVNSDGTIEMMDFYVLAQNYMKTNP
jgi:hypothetical protein